jgi:hypothetical protein
MVARRIALIASAALTIPSVAIAQACVGGFKSPGKGVITKDIAGQVDIGDGMTAFGARVGTTTGDKALNVQLGVRMITTSGGGVSSSVTALSMDVHKVLWQKSMDKTQFCGIVGFDYIDFTSDNGTTQMPIGISWGDLMSPEGSSIRLTYFIAGGVLISSNSIANDTYPFINFGPGVQLKNGSLLTVSYRQVFPDVEAKPVFRFEFHWPFGGLAK